MNRNDILFIHGTDYLQMTKRLLEQADIAAEIGRSDKRIVLKPNLVTASPPSSGATTHAELLAGAIEYLQEHGFRDIIIAEGSWVGARTEKAMRCCGYDKVCAQYHVPFVDLKHDTFHEYNANGMKINVCDLAMHADYFINMPVLKGHCQTTVTCALKNNKGVMPDQEKRRFHAMGLHKPIAHLNTVCKNDFILVDNICGDLDFEEGGNPVVMNRLLGFKDPVLCDSFVCSSMGVDISEVPYISLAEQLGVGSTHLSCANKIYLNDPSEAQMEAKGPQMSRRVKQLTRYTAPIDACSACYGSLIHALNRMDEKTKSKYLNSPICIGQGYQGKSGEVGIGRCTAGCKRSLAGCPPRASDIFDFLTKTED